MKKFSYFFFSIRWLWKNRDWIGTRQKYKAMDRDYQAFLKRSR